MAAPAGFSDLINRKYDIQQEEATGRANLENAQATSITSASPFENALKQAQAAQTAEQTKTVQPLANASIAGTLATAGEAGARSNLFGAQTREINENELGLVNDVGLQSLYRGLQHFSGAQATGANSAAGVGGGNGVTTPTSGTLASGAAVTPAVNVGTGAASLAATAPLAPANTGISLAQPNDPELFPLSYGTQRQHLKKGTANVKAAGKSGAKAAPQQMLQPQASMPAPGQVGAAMPGSSPQASPVGGLAALLQAAMGATTVPGKGAGDKVPAMLEPGEAVVNKGAIKHIPGGRQTIAKANAQGNADRGAPMKRQGPSAGAVTKKQQGGKNHVAVHIKMG